MPTLQPRIVYLRPVVAETGPIGMSTQQSSGHPQPPSSMSMISLKHANFVEQVNALNRGFERHEIVGFTPDELNDHITIALQDNFIIEDGQNTGRYVAGQVAWRLKELTKGYVYERL